MRTTALVFNTTRFPTTANEIFITTVKHSHDKIKSNKGEGGGLFQSINVSTYS
jgi:hypothetical protein